MNVMHYHFGKSGGAESFFVNLVRALANRGVAQTCFIRPDRSWQGAIDTVSTVHTSHFRTLSFDRLLMPLKVSRLAHAEKPDALFAWMPRASRLMPNYKGCIKISRLGDYPLRFDYFKNTDVLVCNTPGIAEHVKAMGWTRGVETISNFTDTTPVDPVSRNLLQTPAFAPVVMGMGRFVPRKGFDMLINAVSKMPGVYLWLVGDGEQREALEQLAQARGMFDRIRFVGWQRDVRPYIAGCDVFCMPSSHEPLGNVVLEAWAQRKPVVSTRSEGPSWFMKDGDNGLLVDIGDVDGLSASLLTVAGDVEVSRKLARRGRETLMEKFSEEAICSAYLDLFRRKP